MSILGDVTRALLGVSTYQSPKGYGPDLSDASVEQIRKAMGGGNLTPLPVTVTRWYLSDLETAQHKADTGDLSLAAALCVAMRTDGVIAGLLTTLTSGLVGLPKRFYGDPDLVAGLRPRNDTPSDFDAMHPPAELALIAGDGVLLGAGVGELLPVPGRDLPVLCRLEPEFLMYRQVENRWYYRSIAGLLPITPGDGRWVLHVPGGRVNPWRTALWKPLGRSYINKEHAMLHRSNYSAKLANPARIATAPLGATEGERQGFISRLMAWGVNSVFELPPGWSAALLESKGTGYEVFKDEVATSDNESMITLAGQIVTTTGGAGFSNSDVQRLIRADILKNVGDGLGHTLNTQTMPAYAYIKKGLDGLRQLPSLEWITKAPKDHEAEARTMTSVGAGIKAVNEALRGDKKVVDTAEVMTRFDLPTRDMTPEEKTAIEAEAKAEATMKNDDGSKVSPDV